MNIVRPSCLYPIRQVMIYAGHQNNPLLGPYFENIGKRIAMFNALNSYREQRGRLPWRVTVVAGEKIIDELAIIRPQETLLVIPAGQSTNLDRVFSSEELDHIQKFLAVGGRGYFNCGSAYWVSNQRVYSDLCTEQPEERKTIVKPARLPLFHGVARGPLCSYPGKKYNVGFFSDAVEVTSGKESCTILLSGGGCFIPDKSDQKLRVLVRYSEAELFRLKKTKEECKAWQNAAILVSVGKGAAMLSMFHPYYGSKDIDVEAYERNFPDSGTNWKAIHEKLSSVDMRMRFVLNSMLIPLEDMDFGSL
jgi:glutamine amidotransferase-like uncharacterized protein